MSTKWNDKDKFFDGSSRFCIGYLLAAFFPPLLAVMLICWIVKTVFSRDY